jgi:5S rRNA maturation endonuclease (ribonuclease M5)
MVRRLKKGPRYYLELEAELRSIIEDINHRVSAVIVEGPHDETALRNSGFKTHIIQFCSSGMPVFAFEDEIVANYKDLTVLVLLDFDDEGTKMADRVAREVEEKGVRVEHFLRKRIGKLLLKERIYRLEEIWRIASKAACWTT